MTGLGVNRRCAPHAYYLLNNYVPAFIGSGQTDPTNNGPFTLPPVISQRHIGDVLTANEVSWVYFGERWNDFKTAPGLAANVPNTDSHRSGSVSVLQHLQSVPVFRVDDDK